MSLPKDYSLRPVQQSDLAQYVEVLSVLTTVGSVSESDFAKLVAHWEENPEIYYPMVVTNEKDVVVATGMLVVERKLIHGCGKVGHIEDIAVAETEQGKKVGQYLIDHLSLEAKARGCYKVILDCAERNVGFYEKCGYTRAGVQMSQRYD